MTSASTRLFLIRHAQSVWNAEGRWQGQADPELSDTGREQARVAADRLEGMVARVVSSDLLRAAGTADIMASVLSLEPVVRDPALREVDVGEWSGLTRAEIEQRWPGSIERWRRGEWTAPGGEERQAFRTRILHAVMRHATNSQAPVLVVTHGAAIGVIERHLDVHPGVAIPSLSGRWFEFDGTLRAVSERVSLVSD